MYTNMSDIPDAEIDENTVIIDDDDNDDEGGATGGDPVGDSTLPPPLQPPQEIDRTNPFQPTRGTSTPRPPPDDGGEAIEMANMDSDEEEFDGDDTSLLTGFRNANEKTRLDEAKQFIKDKFPKVDFKKLDPLGFGKKTENKEKLVTFGKGKKFGKETLYGETRIFKQDGRSLLKSFTDKFKNALGPSSEELISEKTQEERALRQSLAEEEKQLEEKEKQTALEQKTAENVQNLRRRIEETKAKIDAQEEEHGSTLEQQNEIDRLEQLEKNLKADLKNEEIELKQLQKEQDRTLKKVKQSIGKLKKDIYAKTKEKNEIEVGFNRTKPLDELNAEGETLKRKIEEDREIVNDKDSSQQDRMAAGVRFSENTNELARLEPQIQEREESLLLRERVKNIFKKYDWTLQAVVLAVGLVLSALALAGLNGLKAGTKAVGQGLKTVGQKLGSLLPGLIGSIVSYIFKAARQVLSFLGEHAWLLILAVVAFFMERLLKKRRKQ